MSPAQKTNTSTAPTFRSPSSKPAPMSTSAVSTPEITPFVEKLLANIPHLEPNGSNWAIFQMCFCDTMKVTCC